ncbi:DUF6381 family protein [Streptomyces sp. NPDC056883]
MRPDPPPDRSKRARRKRLKDKAQRILDQSKKESDRGSGGIDPM